MKYNVLAKKITINAKCTKTSYRNYYILMIDGAKYHKYNNFKRGKTIH